MKIYYRISNNSYSKTKLKHATKEYCLDNFLKEFNIPKNDIIIIADNVTNSQLRVKISNLVGGNISLHNTTLGNAQSFKYAYTHAISNKDDEVIYFIEDDYLHLPGSNDVLLEGIQRSHYVSLYDHNDKYMEGVNPYIHDGGEDTKVILTKSSHWKLTNSTTMTFASTVKILKEDNAIWMKWLQGNHPMDFDAFIELRNSGRSLITPIPSYSTHTELNWLAPLINWEAV